MPEALLANILTNEYLPWDDFLRYALMIVADVLIVMFWWYVMSRLGDR
jgi:hypothetical protein